MSYIRPNYPKIIAVWAMLFITMTFIALILFGCKKESPTKPIGSSNSVTYTFTSSKVPYCIKIWDSTNLNDFVDSSYSATYTKTINYTYSGAYYCNIEGDVVSKKKIDVVHPKISTSCEDSIYSTLQCFINP